MSDMSEAPVRQVEVAREPQRQRSRIMNVFVRFYSWFVFILECLNVIVTFWRSLAENVSNLIISPSKKSVYGEVVLVTGGGSGIGREICLKFGKLGARVVCWDINKEWSDEVVDEIVTNGGTAWGWAVDVADRESVLNAAEEVYRTAGHVCILINNAGIMPCRGIQSYSEKDIRRMFDINVLGHFWALEAFFPIMRDKQHGHIVGISSVAGQKGAANLVPYSASKFAVRGITDALEMELSYYGDEGIKITTVFPFIVDTGLVQNPKIRFPRIFRVYKTEEAAQVIVDGILAEKSHIWIPGHIVIFKYILDLLPRKAGVAFIDLLGNLCDPHDVGGWRDRIIRGH